MVTEIELAAVGTRKMISLIGARFSERGSKINAKNNALVDILKIVA